VLVETAGADTPPHLLTTRSSKMRFGFISITAGIACTVLTSAALALDLNSFRAQHGRPPLSHSGTLAGAAYSHAHSLAARQRLDHAGFRQRLVTSGGTAAENVAYGCATEDCVIRMWSRSGRHRANMLRRDVASYGLASADGANGRRYWVLELGH
jgi:uncharacterized protein YkwD